MQERVSCPMKVGLPGIVRRLIFFLSQKLKQIWFLAPNCPSEYVLVQIDTYHLTMDVFNLSDHNIHTP